MKVYLLILLIALTCQQIFLSDGKEEERDQLLIEYKVLNTPRENTVLSYPKQLSNNKKHGVVLWCPGYANKAGDYELIIRRLASHGFVVVGLGTSQGDGTNATQALNWIDEKNRDSSHPLFGKLDMDKIGCSGHSLGGIECERAIVADSRIKTFIINNAGDWDHKNMALVDRSKPIAIVYGSNETERQYAEADYGNQTVKAPACLIMMEGEDYGHISGPWDGMAATVAWFRWHLGGAINRKADFVGTHGKYINFPIVGHKGNWKGVCKNF